MRPCGYKLLKGARAEMGCDIHTHIEVKIENTWHHFAKPCVERYYNLFALMGPCGRRPDIKPIAPSRGLPTDISIVTRLSYQEWESEAHGESWLAKHEIEQLKRLFELDMGRKYNTAKHNLEFGIFRTLLPRWRKIQDTRIVFWFDN